MPTDQVSNHCPPDKGSGLLETWLVDIAELSPVLLAIEASNPSISVDEYARAAGMFDPEQSRFWKASRVALRHVLEHRGGAICRQQSFVYAKGGRPRLANSDLAFSLSDTSHWLLIALSSSGRVGIDIEARRTLKATTARLALWVGASTGLAHGTIATSTAIDMAAALMAWTRIEAFAKARGPTLASCLSDLGLIGRGARVTTPDEAENRAATMRQISGLTVHSLAMPDGLFAALAVDQQHDAPAPTVQILDCAQLARMSHG